MSFWLSFTARKKEKSTGDSGKQNCKLIYLEKKRQKENAQNYSSLPVCDGEIPLGQYSRI